MSRKNIKTVNSCTIKKSQLESNTSNEFCKQKVSPKCKVRTNSKSIGKSCNVNNLHKVNNVIEYTYDFKGNKTSLSRNILNKSVGNNSGMLCHSSKSSTSNGENLKSNSKNEAHVTVVDNENLVNKLKFQSKFCSNDGILQMQCRFSSKDEELKWSELVTSNSKKAEIRTKSTNKSIGSSVKPTGFNKKALNNSTNSSKKFGSKINYNSVPTNLSDKLPNITSDIENNSEENMKSEQDTIVANNLKRRNLRKRRRSKYYGEEIYDDDIQYFRKKRRPVKGKHKSINNIDKKNTIEEQQRKYSQLYNCNITYPILCLKKLETPLQNISYSEETNDSYELDNTACSSVNDYFNTSEIDIIKSEEISPITKSEYLREVRIVLKDIKREAQNKKFIKLNRNWWSRKYERKRVYGFKYKVNYDLNVLTSDSNIFAGVKLSEGYNNSFRNSLENITEKPISIRNSTSDTSLKLNLKSPSTTPVKCVSHLKNMSKSNIAKLRRRNLEVNCTNLQKKLTLADQSDTFDKNLSNSNNEINKSKEEHINKEIVNITSSKNKVDLKIKKSEAFDIENTTDFSSKKLKGKYKNEELPTIISSENSLPLKSQNIETITNENISKSSKKKHGNSEKSNLRKEEINKKLSLDFVPETLTSSKDKSKKNIRNKSKEKELTAIESPLTYSSSVEAQEIEIMCNDSINKNLSKSKNNERSKSKKKDTNDELLATFSIVNCTSKHLTTGCKDITDSLSKNVLNVGNGNNQEDKNKQEELLSLISPSKYSVIEKAEICMKSDKNTDFSKKSVNHKSSTKVKSKEKLSLDNSGKKCLNLTENTEISSINSENSSKIKWKQHVKTDRSLKRNSSEIKKIESSRKNENLSKIDVCNKSSKKSEKEKDITKECGSISNSSDKNLLKSDDHVNSKSKKEHLRKGISESDTNKKYTKTSKKDKNHENMSVNVEKSISSETFTKVGKEQLVKDSSKLNFENSKRRSIEEEFLSNSRKSTKLESIKEHDLVKTLEKDVNKEIVIEKQLLSKLEKTNSTINISEKSNNSELNINKEKEHIHKNNIITKSDDSLNYIKEKERIVINNLVEIESDNYQKIEEKLIDIHFGTSKTSSFENQDNESSISGSSKSKHIFKFMNNTERPPTRSRVKICLTRPNDEVFKVPTLPPVKPIVPQVPKIKEHEFDAISIYAETLGTESIKDNASIANESEIIDVDFDDISYMLPISTEESKQVNVNQWVENTVKICENQNQTHFNLLNQKSLVNRTDLDLLNQIKSNEPDEANKLSTLVGKDQKEVIVESPIEKNEGLGTPKTASSSTVNNYNQKIESQSNDLYSKSNKRLSQINSHAHTLVSVKSDKDQELIKLFLHVCCYVKKWGVCKNSSCHFKHELPLDWKNELKLLPVESVLALYEHMKKRNFVFLFKKTFSSITQYLGDKRDFNNLIKMVQDVLILDINSDRTPFISDIIDALCMTGVTFHSIVELVYKSVRVEITVLHLLCDILLNLIIEKGNCPDNWSIIKQLMQNLQYDIDIGVIRIIVIESLKENISKEFFFKVYNDCIKKISDEKLRTLIESVLNNFYNRLLKFNLSNEATEFYGRCRSLNISLENKNDNNKTTSPVINTSKIVSVIKPSQNISLRGANISVPNSLNNNFNLTQQLNQRCPNFVTRNSGPDSGSYISPILNCSQTVVRLPLPAPVMLKKPVVKKNQTWYSPHKRLDPIQQSTSNLDYFTSQIIFNRNQLKEAVFEENISALLSLLKKYKDNYTDNYIQTFIEATLESEHNLPTFFGNLCQGAKMLKSLEDKSQEYIFKTIGLNLVLHLSSISSWDHAYLMYTILQGNFVDDLFNVKIYLKVQFTYLQRILEIARIHIKKLYCDTAWVLIKKCFIQQATDFEHTIRNNILNELLTELMKLEKYWELALNIICFLIAHKILGANVKKYIDKIILHAINNKCPMQSLIHLINSSPDWYTYISFITLRAMLVHSIRNENWILANNLYLRGCSLHLYRPITVNDPFLLIYTSYVREEINLILKIYLRNLIKVKPIHFNVKIRIIEDKPLGSVEDLPLILQQYNVETSTINVRISNILNSLRPSIQFSVQNDIIVLSCDSVNRYLDSLIIQNTAEINKSTGL